MSIVSEAYSESQSSELLEHSSYKFSAGYCHIGTQAVWLKISKDTTSQSCMEKAELETSRLSLKHLGCHNFYEPGDTGGIDISRLNKFLAS